MTEQLIDLTQFDFWLICLLGVIVLGPLTHARSRKVVWAIVNLSFIALILGWNAVGIFAAIPVVYLLIRGISGSHKTLCCMLAVVAVTGLFLLHKLPFVVARTEWEPVSGALATIGFSYVALRLVELLRAVSEKQLQSPDMASLVNYLLPFHMLAAGPIQGYQDFASQADVPKSLSRRDILEAAERITTGLFKKFVLAYAIQNIFLTDFEADGIYFLLEVQIFFLWLYLDFSAYSDLAVGIGRLLGVATPENFDRPYLARNMVDFWNRWHISLSQFIRRNIFIPIQLFLGRKMQGRHSLLVASVAFSISFVLCGLWHGLTVNFLLWGSIHAVGLVIANMWNEYLKMRLGATGVKAYLEDRRIKWVARVVTYEFVAFSLVVLFFP